LNEIERKVIEGRSELINDLVHNDKYVTGRPNKKTYRFFPGLILDDFIRVSSVGGFGNQAIDLV